MFALKACSHARRMLVQHFGFDLDDYSSNENRDLGIVALVKTDIVVSLSPPVLRKICK